jgi:hypothetical protein
MITLTRITRIMPMSGCAAAPTVAVPLAGSLSPPDGAWTFDRLLACILLSPR